MSQSRDNVTSLAACRACGGTHILPVLSLGMMPLANALVPPDAASQPEHRYPLDVVRCAGCSLVQLSVSVDPDILFRDYVYRSSMSDAFLAHARDIVQRVVDMREWDGTRLAVEIASNDGYLLQYYHSKKIPVLGIEPARDIARIAREQRGIDTLEEFFSRELGAALARQNRRADVIHANNVLAHVPDLSGVLAGIRMLLKPNGLAVIEVPSLRDMIDRIEFDTIYHEHLCYFSLTSLAAAFGREGLAIVDVEPLAVHGGSLRIFARRDDTPGAPDPAGLARVADMLASEHAWGVSDNGRYAQFAVEVECLKTKLVALVRKLKAEERSIAAYGASAKGTTLLNYCGLGGKEIDYVVDRSSAKHGWLTPGTHLLIYPPEKLLEVIPDFVLLLVWNFADEIMVQQREYRHRGGRFIVPLPEPQIV